MWSGGLEMDLGVMDMTGCPRFWRTEVQMRGDLIEVVVVDIQAKCTVEDL